MSKDKGSDVTRRYFFNIFFVGNVNHNGNFFCLCIVILQSTVYQPEKFCDSEIKYNTAASR